MFTNNRGDEFRNLTEQVLNNKAKIEGLIQGGGTLAEFGLKVINVSEEGETPVTPPIPLDADDNVFGYSWLVNTGILDESGSNIYNIWIWTRLDYAQEAAWMNLGEFPKRGPKGADGVNGATGQKGDNGLAGVRGSTIRFTDTLPTSGNLDGDMIITSAFKLYEWQSTQWSLRGNIKGPKGDTGSNGLDGFTPYIQNGYWFINGQDTGVKAEGIDGAMLNLQTGIYTVDTLPNFSATNRGDAFAVYEGEPSEDIYDLYFHGLGGVTWSIITDWGGIPGPKGPQGTPGIDGEDGEGVPSGGTTGQVLRKYSNTNYDTYWSGTDFGQLLKAGDTMTGKLLLNNNNVLDILEIRNTSANNYARALYTGDQKQITTGIGNSTAPIEALRNKFYIYDYTESTPMLYGDKDNITITCPLTIPVGTLSTHAINKSQLDSVISNTTKISNENDGFSAGTNSSATRGGAIGWNASATHGGAVGWNSSATTGFAGGYLAKATADSAAQICGGTNSTEGTLQFRTYQLVDEYGNIPVDRLSLLKITASEEIVSNSGSVLKELQPNVYYKFTSTSITSLTISFGTALSGKVSEYMFEFVASSTPTTLSLPSGVTWFNEPTITAGKKYQVSIINNCAVYGEFSI